MIVDPPGQVVAVAALRAGLVLAGWPVTVSTRKPVSPPAGFVVLSRIGGGRRDFATSSPRLLVECYHSNEGDAERLANAATAGLSAVVGQVFAGHYVQWWEDDDNIASLADPNPSHYRFQFTGTLAITLK